MQANKDPHAGNTYPVAEQTPGRDIWADDHTTTVPAGQHEGGYMAEVQAAAAANNLRGDATVPKGDQIAKPAPGGASDAWFESGIKNNGV